MIYTPNQILYQAFYTYLSDINCEEELLLSESFIIATSQMFVHFYDFNDISMENVMYLFSQFVNYYTRQNYASTRLARLLVFHEPLFVFLASLKIFEGVVFEQMASKIFQAKEAGRTRGRQARSFAEAPRVTIQPSRDNH